MHFKGHAIFSESNMLLFVAVSLIIIDLPLISNELTGMIEMRGRHIEVDITRHPAFRMQITCTHQLSFHHKERYSVVIKQLSQAMQPMCHNPIALAQLS